MTTAITFVFTCISRAVSWLASWSFEGIPFLVWLIAFIVIATMLDFLFG